MVFQYIRKQLKALSNDNQINHQKTRNSMKQINFEQHQFLSKISSKSIFRRFQKRQKMKEIGRAQNDSVGWPNFAKIQLF